jgi:hypothetical protein
MKLFDAVLNSRGDEGLRLRVIVDEIKNVCVIFITLA